MARKKVIVFLILSLSLGLNTLFSQGSSSPAEVKIIARLEEKTKERVFAVGDV